ncbi:hypothetical protein JTB14_018455 [Gonioctena quinquepunctata]|nr:hypothetical protein JTB14_018455 [Gonioctena quinquepunctata]
MVVFTCNHCGESLQKPRVEKHYMFVCRRPKFVTCVDCFKDFREEEYVVHTKCVTEEERYAAKGSMPNGVVKKGEVKQESWIEMVRSILDEEPNLKPSHQNLLNNILNFNNIPRKKPKFMNFIKSSSGGRVNMKDVEDVWNIIEKYKTAQSKDSSANNEIKSHSDDNTNQIPAVDITAKKKRKNLDEGDTTESKKMKTEEPSVEEVQSENGKFNFQDKIVDILKLKGSVSFKKLEKKVIKAYLKHSGESEVTPKIVKKFSKQLRKSSEH